MDHEGKKQCTNCKCWRIQADFIGNSGNEVKNCLKCREKDAKKKQKPENIEKKKELQKEKKYYQKSRDKQREENEEEFKKNNAEKMRIWREKKKAEHSS